MVRAPDGVDARVKRLRTARRGANLARRAVKLVEAVDDEVFGDGPDDHLMTTLHRLAGRDAQGNCSP